MGALLRWLRYLLNTFAAANSECLLFFYLFFNQIEMNMYEMLSIFRVNVKNRKITGLYQDICAGIFQRNNYYSSSQRRIALE